jgi:thioredoxin reductase (NADPH)
MSPVRPNVHLVGRRLAPGDHEVRDFLTRAAQPSEWHEWGSPEATELLERHRLTEADLPVVIDGDAAIARATLDKLADAWKLNAPPRRSHYDLAIIGAGPAGLAAAVYAASDGLSTLLIERDIPGGQASHASLIENFFGFPEGIPGAELARLAGRQAERFGAELLIRRGVVRGRLADAGKARLTFEGGYEATATIAVAATGMEWRRLAVPGIEELLGRGVYYGAGRSEATQCEGEDVVVVGAGNSAGQAAMNLAKAGARVLVVARGEGLARSMSAYLVKRIEEHPAISLRTGSQVVEVHEQQGLLRAVTIDHGGTREKLPADALFICIGGQPRTRWAADVAVRTDERGYILTGPDLLDAGRRPKGWPLARDPLPLETSLPGFFAAGDVRHGSTNRVAGAVGDGAMAVVLAHRRLDELAAAS